jgi:iron-sulfur cluster insertion protein
MIDVTQVAASKISELLAEEQKVQSGLRVFVQGGGRSGFQYGMMIEENPGESDLVFESNGVKVYVDPISLSDLKAAEGRFRRDRDRRRVHDQEPERGVDLWVRLVVLGVVTEVTRFTLNDSGQTARPDGRRRKSRRPCVAPRSSSGHALAKAAPLAEGRGLDGTASMPRSMLGGSQ